MIGLQNYTVILTYLSVISAVVGMVEATMGNTLIAIFCLLFSGICDMFDGTVARTKKQRTDSEKKFGIQLDSLSDTVSFGVLPVMIAYSMGMNKPWDIVIFVIYVLAAIIRLAYYNILEEESQQENDRSVSAYCGLPVTSISLILPAVYSFSVQLGKYLPVCLEAVMLLVSVAFVSRIRIKKIGTKGKIVLIIIGAMIVAWIIAGAVIYRA